METEYMEGILSELFHSNETALNAREDTMVIEAMEFEKIPFVGSTVVHYPGGYLERHWASIANEWETINLPEHLIAENTQIIKERAVIKDLQKVVKSFLRRAFLKAETVGDLSVLIPENMHVHFSAQLERAIYNSAPVLNRWAITQFLDQEQEALAVIRRQLLENVILRD